MLSAVLDDHDLKHVWLQQLFETLAESGKTIHLKKKITPELTRNYVN